MISPTHHTVHAHVRGKSQVSEREGRPCGLGRERIRIMFFLVIDGGRRVDIQASDRDSTPDLLYNTDNGMIPLMLVVTAA